MKLNKNNTEAFSWGDNCKGWHLLNQKEFGVIQQLMPAGAIEGFHYHEKAEQFFTVIKGEATFRVEDDYIKVGEGEHIHIKPTVKHCVINKTLANLEFVVVSKPHALGDRIEVE